MCPKHPAATLVAKARSVARELTGETRQRDVPGCALLSPLPNRLRYAPGVQAVAAESRQELNVADDFVVVALGAAGRLPLVVSEPAAQGDEPAL
jgi:hypothetical protein